MAIWGAILTSEILQSFDFLTVLLKFCVMGFRYLIPSYSIVKFLLNVPHHKVNLCRAVCNV
jgi:hypothetical protein